MDYSKSPTLAWLRVLAPAGFLGYGVYLVTRSVPLAALAGVAVFLAVRFLLGLQPPRPDGNDQPPGSDSAE